MFNKIRMKFKKWWLYFRYGALIRQLDVYEGRKPDQLSFREKWDILEIMEMLQDMNDELEEIFTEIGSKSGLETLKDCREKEDEMEADIKRSMFRVVRA